MACAGRFLFGFHKNVCHSLYQQRKFEALSSFTPHNIPALCRGVVEAPDAATGIFPLFERLLREELEGKEGPSDTPQRARIK